MSFRRSGLTVLSTLSLILAVGCNDEIVESNDDATGSGTEENSTFDTGDGDGDTGDGDGDTGDGDGDPTGDGDGDPTGDGDGDPTGDGDGDPDAAPFVIATSPAVNEDGVSGKTTITVTFSEPMDPDTVTTNTENKDCSGAIGVSFDNFFGCVQMVAQPTSDDNTTFTLTPLDGALLSMTEYRIRVTNAVTDAGGTPMEAFYIPADGFMTRYFHTIQIDGVNDFEADETFLSSTVGHVGYIAWDEDYLYLGMNSPDLAANDPMTWFVAYLGGMPGSDSGVLYNTQQPLIPFLARYHLRWKASDDYGGALEWDGDSWFDPGFGPIAGGEDVATMNTFVEMRVAWSDLDLPDVIEVHLGMLREENLVEACWAAVPADSHDDGYDPDYTQFYQFDVLASMYPSEYDPI